MGFRRDVRMSSECIEKSHINPINSKDEKNSLKIG